VNVQKKKISPGHGVSGVSWQVYVDELTPTTTLNDIA
jgi:hypothetical protein